MIKNRGAARLRDISAVGLLAALTVIFFWPIFFTASVAYGRDLFVIFYPWRKFILSSLAQGTIPLWNPYTYSGSPFLANMHSAVLYPLNAFLLLAPLAKGLAYFAVLHIFMAAFFMYLYAREIGATRGGSFAAAISFAFSGWFLKHFEVIAHPVTVAWMPLVFLFYEKALKRGGSFVRNKHILLGGAAFALQVFSGHPLFIYTVFSLLLYSVFLAVGRRGDGASSRAKPLALFGLIVGLGSLFSAAQLLPAYEYMIHSNRADISYGYVTQLSLPVKQLLGAFAPYIFGDPADNSYWGEGFLWMMTIYVGVGAIFLSLIAALANFKDIKVKFFCSLAILSLLLSLGSNTPLYYLVYALPVFGKLRYPAMFVSTYIFAVAALSAAGYDSLERARGSRAVMIPALVVFAAAALSLGGMIYLHWNRLYLLSWFLSYLNLQAVRDALGFFSTMAYRTALAHLYLPFILTAVLAAAAALLMLVRRSAGLVKVFLLIFMPLDLLIFGVKLSPLTSSELYSVKPESAAFLIEDKDYFRIWAHHKARVDLAKFYNYSFRPSGFGDGRLETLLKMKEALPYNLPMVYGIFSAMGYDSIKVGRYRKYAIAAEEAFDKSSHLMLDMLNIKYIMSYDELSGEDLEEVWSGGSGMRIYLNKAYLPRTYFARSLKPARGEEAILEELNKPGFDPRAHILVDEADLERLKIGPAEDSVRGSKQRGEDRAAIIAFSPNSIKIRATATADSYLVLSEVFFPGWKAYIDGTAAEILPANLIFRAVRLTAGEHEVVFNYEPFSFRLGAALSILSIAAALLYSFMLRRTTAKKDLSGL